MNTTSIALLSQISYKMCKLELTCAVVELTSYPLHMSNDLTKRFPLLMVLADYR